MMEKAKDKAAETTEKHTGFNALVSGLGIAPVSAFYIVCNTLSTYNSPGKTNNTIIMEQTAPIPKNIPSWDNSWFDDI